MRPNWDELIKDYIHDENNIKGFAGEYRWLSNFYVCPVMFDGMLFPSSENAYQAAKCVNADDRIEFINLTSAESKKLGRKIESKSVRIEFRHDWKEIKFDVMKAIVFDKFHRNKDLERQLVDTGNKYLEETNWWNDQYWGVFDKIGHNNLGRIQMATRDFLRIIPIESSR